MIPSTCLAEVLQEDMGENAVGEDETADSEEYKRDPDAYMEKLKSRHRLVAHRVEQRRIRRLKKLGVTGSNPAAISVSLRRPFPSVHLCAGLHAYALLVACECPLGFQRPCPSLCISCILVHCFLLKVFVGLAKC